MSRRSSFQRGRAFARAELDLTPEQHEQAEREALERRFEHPTAQSILAPIGDADIEGIGGR
jgi:hypothetical protein